MRIAYYDESGDDGFPIYTSPLFVLSAVYLHYLNWKATFDQIHRFRRDLHNTYGLPVKMELHTREFLLNKNPYQSLGISDANRNQVISLVCDLIASLDVKIVNVAIIKPRLRSPKYNVLDTALKYSVQRIENDLDPVRNPEAKFIIITDPGRVGKMRMTTRKIQRINFIPSKFSPQSYRQEIKSLIEDPLPKDSKESYFIQMADLISYVVYLHVLTQTKVAGFAKRLPSSPDQVNNWMDRIKPSINLLAASNDPYGIVYHPH
jgi:hypothetical protein